MQPPSQMFLSVPGAHGGNLKNQLVKNIFNKQQNSSAGISEP